MRNCCNERTMFVLNASIAGFRSSWLRSVVKPDICCQKVCPSACLSVCLSVTLVNHVQTVKNLNRLGVAHETCFVP